MVLVVVFVFLVVVLVLVLVLWLVLVRVRVLVPVRPPRGALVLALVLALLKRPCSSLRSLFIKKRNLALSLHRTGFAA